MKPRVWFVTGASRGLGLAIAKTVLEHGDIVVTASRDVKRSEKALGISDRLLALSMDVTDAASIQAATATAIKHFGRIDVVVNNAGYGIVGAVEEVDDQELDDIFKTNVFGALNVTRAMLPTLRTQRSGHIVNISSIAGIVAAPGWGMYNATKFALEGWSEALFQELAPLGIHVTIVEPGYFRTDFLNDSMSKAKRTIADYAETAGQMRATAAARDGQQPGDPRKAALAIIKAVEAKEPPLRLALGKDAFERIGNKLLAVRRDLDNWRDLTINTDFDAETT